MLYATYNTWKVQPVCHSAATGRIMRPNKFWLAWASRLSVGKPRRLTISSFGSRLCRSSWRASIWKITPMGLMGANLKSQSIFSAVLSLLFFIWEQKDPEAPTPLKAGVPDHVFASSSSTYQPLFSSASGQSGLEEPLKIASMLASCLPLLLPHSRNKEGETSVLMQAWHKTITKKLSFKSFSSSRGSIGRRSRWSKGPKSPPIVVAPWGWSLSVK